MYKFRKLIAPLTLSVGLVLGTACSATPMEHGQTELHRVLAQLGLSQAQRQDIRQLFKDGRADRALFREDKRSFKQQLHALIQSPDWDAVATSVLLKEQQEIKSQMDLQRAIARHKLWLVLDTAQQGILSTLLKQDPPHPAPEAEGLKLLNELNLTAEQHAQIEPVLENTQEIRQRLAANHQQYVAAENALINTQEFDQTQWQNLHTNLLADNLPLSVSIAQSRNHVWNILDEEQQQQLVELIKAHKKDRESHNREHRMPPPEI